MANRFTRNELITIQNVLIERAVAVRRIVKTAEYVDPESRLADQRYADDLEALWIKVDTILDPV